MQIIWRTLPRLALPAALGLGLAYLATGFVPRPAPNLRPPEELRAHGQGYAEESPVRTILERNVLMLEIPLFYPLGQPPAPVPQPQKPAAQPPAQAAFAPADISLAPAAASRSGALAGQPAGQPAGLPAGVSAPLSGGSSVQGLVAPPAVAQPAYASVSALPPSAPVFPASSASAPVQVPPLTTKGQAVPATAQPRPAAPAHAAPVARTAAQAAADRGLEGFRLVGVIAGGERPLAMLQVDGTAVSLRVGELVRGWTLVSVEPGQVLLRRGQELRRLALGTAKP